MMRILLTLLHPEKRPHWETDADTNQKGRNSEGSRDKGRRRSEPVGMMAYTDHQTNQHGSLIPGPHTIGATKGGCLQSSHQWTELQPQSSTTMRLTLLC